MVTSIAHSIDQIPHRTRAQVGGWLWVAAITTALFTPKAAVSQEIDFDRSAIFNEVWEAVLRDFFAADFNGVDWVQSKAEYEPIAASATTRGEFADAINRMLAKLNTSHTHYFSTSDPKRYQLLGIFEFLAPADRRDLVVYDGIGIETVVIDNRTFVRSVYDGHSAALSGIEFGDEIVSVDREPYQPLQSFAGKAGSNVSVEIRRAEGNDTLAIAVSVCEIDARTMFETALRASVRTIPVDTPSGLSRSIGYVHMWSYAGGKYHEALKGLVLFGELSDCDALILDLRDGWGGASLEYLNLFRKPALEVRAMDRDERIVDMSGVWRKPVVLLVNERTTSGKELFSYGFKLLGLGELVGSNTAGAVLGGRPKLLANGDVLYVAVSDFSIDGARLEGVGVAPTIPVERPIAYAGGSDPQLQAAIDVMVKSLK